jgi:hypothetical protein
MRDELLQIARTLAPRRMLSTSSPEALVEAQVAVLLRQLDRQLELNTAIERYLLRTECYLETLLLPLPGGYLEHSPSLKAWVRERQLSVDAERRRLLMEHEHRIVELETRLLHALSQRLVLGEVPRRRP